MYTRMVQKIQNTMVIPAEIEVPTFDIAGLPNIVRRSGYGGSQTSHERNSVHFTQPIHFITQVRTLLPVESQHRGIGDTLQATASKSQYRHISPGVLIDVFMITLNTSLNL